MLAKLGGDDDDDADDDEKTLDLTLTIALNIIALTHFPTKRRDNNATWQPGRGTKYHDMYQVSCIIYLILRIISKLHLYNGMMRMTPYILSRNLSFK